MRMQAKTANLGFFLIFMLGALWPAGTRAQTLPFFPAPINGVPDQ
jgi:hypothetical protein